MGLQSVIKYFILWGEGCHANTFLILRQNQCCFYSTQVSVCPPRVLKESSLRHKIGVSIWISQAQLQVFTRSYASITKKIKSQPEIPRHTTTTTRQPLRDNQPPRPNLPRLRARIQEVRFIPRPNHCSILQPAPLSILAWLLRRGSSLAKLT